MKLAIIMRGVPGSGKSTMARQLAQLLGYNDDVIHSTDNYFIVNGEYQFDPSKIRENHTKNFEAFKADCEEGLDVVICDNTNTQKWEYERYVSVARDNGYAVALISTPMLSVEESFERNTHEVPRESIQAMISRWEE